jgi:hypothetical protein
MAERHERDLRIDFFRGLALWMILTDHVSGNLLRAVTYQHVGYSDATEIFVFLSGLSCCLLYGRLLSDAGFAAAQRRALRRVAQIYLGYLVVVLLSFAVVGSFRDILGGNYLAANEFQLLLSEPGWALTAAVLLFYTPQYLDILPLYMILVALAPVIVLGLRRAPSLTITASLLLWLAGTFFSLNLPNLVPGGVSEFNPFSWQILFCIGIWIGERHYVRGAPFRLAPLVAALCWAIIAANLALRGLAALGHGQAQLHVAVLDALYEQTRGVREDPVRLSHFLAVAAVTAALTGPRPALLRRRWTRPLIWCGQNSLEVFCLGVLLSQLGSVYLRAAQPGLGRQLLANLAGWALLSAVGWWCGWRKRAKRRVDHQSQPLSPAELAPP